MNQARESGWWDDLLPTQPQLHPPGADEMLRVIAYDIACPRRLRRVAEVCRDHGVRVQKSVFECWLDDDRFEQLWTRLQKTIRPQADLILVYTLDAAAARRRRTAGSRSVVSEHRRAIMFCSCRRPFRSSLPKGEKHGGSDLKRNPLEIRALNGKCHLHKGVLEIGETGFTPPRTFGPACILRRSGLRCPLSGVRLTPKGIGDPIWTFFNTCLVYGVGSAVNAERHW